MGRGLDGHFSRVRTLAGCAVLKVRVPPGRGRRCTVRQAPALTSFRWLLRGGNTSSHSEQSSYSPVAPMVLGLQGPGRVGRRRSFEVLRSRPVGGSSWLYARHRQRAGRVRLGGRDAKTCEASLMFRRALAPQEREGRRRSWQRARSTPAATARDRSRAAHAAGRRAIRTREGRNRREIGRRRPLTVAHSGDRHRSLRQKGQNTGTSRIATTPNSASNGRPSFQ